MYMFYNKILMPQRLIKKGGKWYEAVLAVNFARFWGSTAV
jgi:hypothetical protein